MEGNMLNIKKIMVVLVTCALSTSVAAKIHRELSQVGLDSDNNPAIAINNQSLFYAVGYNKTADGNILSLARNARSGNGFRQSATQQLDLNTVQGLESHNAFVISSAHAADETVFALVSSGVCEQGSCIEKKTTLLAMNRLAELETDFYDDAVFSFPDTNTCDVPATMTAMSDRLIVSTCDSLLVMPYGANEGFISLASEENSLIFYETLLSAPYVDLGDEDTPASFVDTDMYLVRISAGVSGNELTVDKKDNEGVALWSGSYPVSQGSFERCRAGLAGNDIILACLNQEGELIGQLIDGESTVQKAIFPFSEVPDDVVDFSVSGIDGHIFVIYQLAESGKVVNYNFSGDVFTQRDIASKAVSKDDLSNLFTGRVEAKPVIERTGLFIATGVVGDERSIVSVYDVLDRELGPRFTTGFGGRFGSQFAFDVNLSFEDEDRLPQDIEVSFSRLPIFSNYDEEDQLLSFFAEHSDVGEYEILATLIGSGDEPVEQTGSFEVVLSGYQVLVFEPSLFERIEQDAPVNLSSLIDALGEIRVLEDEDIEFTLSYDGRLASEIQIIVEGLPSWLTFNEEALTISGVPTQSDVGLIEGVTFTFTDIYDPESLVVNNLVLDVVEVDEAFEVTSNGTSVVNVGDQFTYKLTISDEETLAENMEVTASNLPNWMSYDAQTQTLSGVATNERIGDLLVQLIVRDEGGFTAVHSFTVTVNGEGVKEAGGSMSVYLLLMLSIVTVFRRQK